jgi:hypothetical protein
MEFLLSATTPLVLDFGRVTSAVGKRICDGRQQALASRRNRDHEGESQVRHAEAMTSARMWNQIICPSGDGQPVVSRLFTRNGARVGVHLHALCQSGQMFLSEEPHLMIRREH